MATASSRVSVGCPEGRNSDEWIDFDFFGQQIVAHKVKEMKPERAAIRPTGMTFPFPHFGIILAMKDWQQLTDRLTAAGTKFDIEPYVHFKGEPGKQATMFFRDRSPCAGSFSASRRAEKSQFSAQNQPNLPSLPPVDSADRIATRLRRFAGNTGREACLRHRECDPDWGQMNTPTETK